MLDKILMENSFLRIYFKNKLFSKINLSCFQLFFEKYFEQE